jgi:CheY-like chemotaxis protein
MPPHSHDEELSGPGPGGSSESFTYRILVVDDQEPLRETTAAVLRHEGYLVQTASDGFDALVALRGSQPEILVSELKMPNMSGFELLALVRKRFPGIGVVAYTDEFSPLGLPEGVLADRFLMKAENSSFELVEIVRDLITKLPVRAQPAKVDTAPAWLPRSSTGYVVVTCPSCLRSFSVPTHNFDFGVVHKDTCIHCGAELTYRLDQTMSAAEQPNTAEKLRNRLQSSKRAIDRSHASIEASQKRISGPKD